MGSVSLKKKRVLVTGGNGYLGSHLVAALRQEGAIVSIIDHKTTGAANEYAVDITNREDLAKTVARIKPQIIYHLAATLNRDRDFTNHDKVMQINYFGTLNLLYALQNINYDNFIFTSTSEVYGSNKAPFNEKQLPQPASPYSLSKVFSETAIRTFSELHKKNFTILRLFNFFGKDMPTSFFIPQLVNSLRTEPVFKMTKGEQYRDFLYVTDIVQGLILAAKNDNAKNETFNVCSGQSTTLRELVTEFKKHIKSKCKIEFGALPYRENEVWNMVGSNKKIKSMLGFKVNYNITKAIDKLITDQ